jgi:hypothetical protein
MGESIWPSNWSLQHASYILRMMESLASISVSTQLSTGPLIGPVRKSMDRSAAAVWTGSAYKLNHTNHQMLCDSFSQS